MHRLFCGRPKLKRAFGFFYGYRDIPSLDHLSRKDAQRIYNIEYIKAAWRYASIPYALLLIGGIGYLARTYSSGNLRILAPTYAFIVVCGWGRSTHSYVKKNLR